MEKEEEPETGEETAAFGKLITARQDAHSVQNGYFDQRDELNPKSQAKTAADRQECF